MEIRFAKHELVELTGARPLTSQERSVLSFLVRGSNAALCQLKNATVTKECVDHCGSLIMAVRSGACDQIPRDGLLASAEWRFGDTVQDVLLFVEHGYVRWLETYRGDAEIPRGLPRADDLTMLFGVERPTR
jgi:hypothetical protein